MHYRAWWGVDFKELEVVSEITFDDAPTAAAEKYGNELDTPDTGMDALPRVIDISRQQITRHIVSDNLLIREEYKEALSFLRTVEAPEKGAIIHGEDGIGL